MKLFITIRALNFIALFIFTINPFLYSQILKNIESNFLTINSDIIYNYEKTDSLILFVEENKGLTKPEVENRIARAGLNHIKITSIPMALK